MWDLAISNIRRQRTRTFLTVLGIIIGIAAIVALGSISEGINADIQQSLELVGGKIVVSEEGASMFMMGFAGSDLTDENVETLEDVSGVKDVAPILYHIGEMVSFGGPEWVAIGIGADKAEYFSGEKIRVLEGRDLEPGDGEVMVAGSNFAEKQDLEVGDFFTLEETDLEVIGLLEESGISDIDNDFIVPIETMQDILDMDNYQMIYVIPDDIRETEIIAERIEDADENFDALTSTDIARQAGEIVNQIRIFTLGVGAIAALVGGLGIMNTMIMAVLERRREIGVMKAIGATRRRILVHFLMEAALLSLIGGIVGIILGSIGAMGMGMVMGFARMGVTPALVLGSLGFALLLGIVGGFYPAWKASKLDPVEALRYE